ncbi:MAG: NUDIX domain-containing protein [Rhizobiaceae bacterium]
MNVKSRHLGPHGIGCGRRRSAGILAYRWRMGSLEVLLGHPGGPAWNRRDEGAWSILKGEHDAGDDPEAAARRRFTEATGWRVTGPIEPLGEIRQPLGKIITAYSADADFDPATLLSKTFELEWPPGSGRMRPFPETDCVQWFTLAEAESKIVPGQAEFLHRLADCLRRKQMDPQPPDSVAAASVPRSESPSEPTTMGHTIAAAGARRSGK